MKKITLTCIAAALAATLAQAGPADDVKAAAKKLGDAPNYSWTATTEIANSQFNMGPTEGKWDKSGLTVTTMSTPNGQMQTVRQGEQMVMQSPQGGWMTMEEMRERMGGGGGGAPGAGGAAPGAGGRAAGGGGGRGFGMFGGGGGRTPAEQVATLVSQIKEAKVVDGVIVAELTAEQVAPMLSFGGRGGPGGGQTPPAPKNASGAAKFWLKDGALVKYEIHVKGTVSGRDGQEREVDRTTTTEFKNVGSTKVEVPEEAKKKLGA